MAQVFLSPNIVDGEIVGKNLAKPHPYKYI